MLCIVFGVLISSVGFQVTSQETAAAIWAQSLGEAQRLSAAGHFEEARVLLSSALEAAKELDPYNPRVSITLNDLGSVYHALGKFSEAENTYLSAIRLLEVHGGSSHPAMSRLLDNLASLYMEFGSRYTQAYRLRTRALSLRVAEVGSEDPGVAVLLANLSTTQIALGKLKEAADSLKQALQIQDKRDQETPETAGILQNLAVVASERRRYAEAERYLERANRVYEKVLAADHPDLTKPLLNLARIRNALNRPLSAEPALVRALWIAETRLGPKHPMTAEILLTYAEVLGRTKRKAESAEVKRRALSIIDGHPDLKVVNSKVHVTDLIKPK